MAGGKLFIGRKVRELRLQGTMTQSQFAERLGISTSYLNQIENNQRPVSAAVLLALAEKFELDLTDLASGEGDRLLSALSEALTDPLFENYSPGLQELKLVVQNAPGFAHALLAAHQAYRRRGEQLVSYDDTASPPEATPYEEVRDFFHFVDNYLHELDTAAETLAGRIGIGEADNAMLLSAHLEKEHGVRVLRLGPESALIREYDPAQRTLAINASAPQSTRTFQMALLVGQLHAEKVIGTIAAGAGFRSEEALAICRAGLQNYFAGALILPYRRFLAAAHALRHDLELLSVRFGASLEQVCHRLSTLQRPGQKGVPIFFARVDRAGNITKRHSAAKLQFARFGAACPLWNVYQAFEQPGRIIRQLAETPDGARYLCLATQITRGGGGFFAPRSIYALALGCEVSYADSFVYADDLDAGNRAAFSPIGISCRICERANCPSRAIPPFRSTITVDENVRHFLPYVLN